MSIIIDIKKKFNLDFKEQQILLLNRKVFDLDYNPNKKEEISKSSRSHQDIINIMFLLETIANISDFGFMLDSNGLSSPYLEFLLKNLDKKTMKIKLYYDYLDNLLEKDRYTYLNEFFSSSQLLKIEQTINLIKPFIKKNREGLQYLATLYYISKYMLPNVEYKFIINRYNELYPNEKNQKKLLIVRNYLECLKMIEDEFKSPEIFKSRVFKLEKSKIYNKN